MDKGGRSCSANSDGSNCYRSWQLRPCLVAMEACGGAHYWAPEIARRGHEVRLMSPRFVRPYVKFEQE
jgi:transposase